MNFEADHVEVPTVVDREQETNSNINPINRYWRYLIVHTFH